MLNRYYKVFIVLLLAVSMLAIQPAAALAHHPWSNYHWARSSNPAVVRLGDNVSPTWKPYLKRAAYHWNRASVLETPLVVGNTNPTLCRSKTAQVQVCSANYGKTTWMGLAQLYVYGDHITGATVKVNDYYFNMPQYNTTGWRNLVMCQEVGHIFGLAHQDENFANKPMGTCMDYSSDTFPNQQPNMHDYYQLLYIYNHKDVWNSVQDVQIMTEDTAVTDKNDYQHPSQWGTKLKQDASIQGNAQGDTSHVAEYERDLGSGKKLRTIVHWAKL